MDETVGIELRAIDHASGTIGRVHGALGALSRMGTGSLGQLGGILGRGLSNATANLERYAVRLGFLAVGAGTAAVKWAVDFQSQMELIATQTGENQSKIAGLSAGVRALVSSTGTGPIALAQMLYHVESAGIRGAQALDIVRVAALGVKVGLVDDAEQVANAMIAITYSGISGAKNAEQAMATLVAIVGTGNMRLGDLVSAMGTGILGTSKTFGISLQSMGAAIAVLTDAGVKAQPAATRLQMMFTHMAAPVPGALKIFKKIGLGQFDLAKDLRSPDGIFVALADLRTHLIKMGEGKFGADGLFQLTPKGTADVSKIFGGSRFGAAAMQLLGMADRVQQKYGQITGQQDQFQQKVVETQQTAKYQFGQLWANIQNVGVAVGDALIPGLLKLNTALNTVFGSNNPAVQSFITNLGSAFSTFIDKMLAVDWGSVADGLKSAAMFAGGLVGAFAAAPDWVKGLLISGFALNKVTGGAVTDIAGLGIKVGLSTISSLLSKLPGAGGVIGSALGAAIATPVRVVNWPLGFGSGMPGGGMPGGGMSMKWLGGTIISAAALVEAEATVWNDHIMPGIDNMQNKNNDAVSSILATNDPKAIASALAQMHANVDSLSGLQKVMYDFNASGVKGATEQNMAALQAWLDQHPAPQYGPLRDRTGGQEYRAPKIYAPPPTQRDTDRTLPRVLAAIPHQVPPDERVPAKLQTLQDSFDRTKQIQRDAAAVEAQHKSENHFDFITLQVQMAAMIGVLRSILAKPTTVVVSPSARQTDSAHQTQSTYGPTRNAQLGAMNAGMSG